MRVRGATAAVVLAACLALPSAAAGLSLSVTTPPGALSPFKPGSTGATTAVLAVTSLTGWMLTASDTSATTPAAGHLVRSSSCSLGVSFLAQALSITLTPTLGGASSAGAVSLSGSPQTLATGTGANTLNGSFSQPIGGSEALQAGCAYSVTVTFTLS